MKGIRMSTRDRRALLGGAAALILVLAISRGLPAYLAWQREARSEDAELRRALSSANSVIALSEATRDSTITRGRRVIALAPAILSGDTPNSAGATLAGVLSGAAAQSGVRLGAIQLRSDSLSRDAFTHIGAHMEATGDIRGVAAMLGALERGPTLLAIRSLSITQPDLLAGDDRVEALRVELDVEGVMLNPRRAR
jgi:hypothetical protein